MSAAIESLLKEGYQARRAHRSGDAKAAFAQAATLSQESHNHTLLAQSLTGLGQIERDQGDIEASIQHYQQAADIYRTLDDPLRLAHTIRHVGDILREFGPPNPALPCYEEALRIYRTHPNTDTLDLANALRGYALLQSDLGKIPEAIELWKEAGTLYNQVWQEPNSPYQQSDLAPGIIESRHQIDLLSAR
ncbi:MAG TPA: tetratricopeptide repeat protein [Acidobacteriaceae bacterium]|jgi:tetratricopeptide (TPR) repeat protein|nr:tetratricopeptide repeat protein [Acidobacteriaceae bacterium]